MQPSCTIWKRCVGLDARLPSANAAYRPAMMSSVFRSKIKASIPSSFTTSSWFSFSLAKFPTAIAQYCRAMMSPSSLRT